MKSLATWPLLFIFILLNFVPTAQAGMPLLSPEQTIRQVYQPYTGDTAYAKFDPSSFSARLRQAITLDEKLTLPGDGNWLDADPLCNCQDFQHLVLENVTVEQKYAGHADAKVRFRPFSVNPETVSQTLRLVAEGNRWVVDDIISNENSLYHSLNSNNQQTLAALAAMQREQPQDYVRALFEHLNDATWPWTWVVSDDYRQAVEIYEQAAFHTDTDKTHDWQYLYANPLCNCDATQFVSLNALKVVEHTATSARVQVKLMLGNNSQQSSFSQVLNLQRIEGDWTVADVVRPQEGSLLAQMRATTSKMEKGN